jgi:putative phage-type endonuclease
METNNRKITPTGLLVLSVDAPREAWLAERKNGITATDLPKILGLSRYGTAIDVWTGKLEESIDPLELGIGQNEAAFWGVEFEDVVARAWAKHKDFTVRRIGIIANEAEPWQRASLDRLVVNCPDGKCALEVKTRSTYKADSWEEGVPAEELAQVEWQLLVSGLDHIHVIALIGGQKLREHVVERSGIDVERLVTPARTVWESVSSGIAPKLPEANWTHDYLEQLHETRDGETEVSTEVMLTATAYDEVTQQISVLEDRKAELRLKLVGALGEFESATWNGEPVYSYKASTRKTLNSKKLVELFPQVSENEEVWNVSTSRTLRVNSKKESK